MPNRNRKSSSRKLRGGFSGSASPSTYSDAASYGRATVGDLNSQLNNSLKGHDNSLVGLQGQTVGPRPTSQSGGGSRKRSKKGGFWGQILNQAIVPFSLLGMQNTYRRKQKGGKNTRRKRRN